VPIGDSVIAVATVVKGTLAAHCTWQWWQRYRSGSGMAGAIQALALGQFAVKIMKVM